MIYDYPTIWAYSQKILSCLGVGKKARGLKQVTVSVHKSKIKSFFFVCD